MSNFTKKSSARRKKEQRAKALAGKQLWADKMGPTPDYFDDDTITFTDNLSAKPETESWEKLPPHLIKHDLQEGPDATPTFDKHRHKFVVAAEATRARTDENAAYVADLKYRYPDRWGTRGQAKVIAGLESDAGEKISVRTIQKYFADDRASQKSHK